MTILPLVTFLLGIALAALFEAAYNYVEKRWSTPTDREQWTGLFWLFIVLVMGLCGVLPYKLPDVLSWLPFLSIACLHAVLSLNGNGFHSLPRPSRPNPPGSGTSSRTNPPKDRHIHKGQ